ncbi:Methyl coenzyme M reductase, subunit D [Thermoplasmatales archaeon BRNA1]|nr:Methyl coenzyme M reductase, subunit D [Thermoplasmatales archaeon BRNA1]
MTNRLLSAQSTEAVLNAIDDIEHIRQVNMSGENLPATINSGPAKGMSNNHTERQIIHVGQQEVELHCLVGAFYIELEVDDKDMLEATVDKIKAACDEHIKDGYSLEIGRYSKYRPSLTDYRSA